MKERILSGMRPTGKLHLGHFVGALANWVALQDKYECFYMVADWHALDTDYADTSKLRENTEEMVLDWLAFGLNPKRSCLFVQSHVPEHAVLNVIFSTITPVSWLERCPTYKQQLQELSDREIRTHGFLGYPVLQAVDILIYKATRVPVGEDQLPHLELTREIARRFNYFYGPLFPEPQALLTKSSRLPGTDGRKMSKSYGNSILLSDTENEIGKKIKNMITDPARIHVDDTGHPDVCVAYQYWKAFAPEHAAEIEPQCKQGKIGCVACKKKLAEIVIETLRPYQEKRREYEKQKNLVREILEDGSMKARKIASGTLAEANELMKMW
jgi:tryptophanyl-tRNA synthetase